VSAETTTAPRKAATPARRRESIDWGQVVSNYAAVGVLIAFIVGFSIARPETFPTLDNFQSIVLTQSVAALAAFALVAPLVAGEFDLSMGAAISVGAVVVAKLLGAGFSPITAILVTIAVGIVIGLANAFLIVGLKVTSFIATLGTGIILDGMAIWISANQTVFEGIGTSFTKLGTGEIFGFLPLPGLYVLVAAALLWYVLERTPLGREMYIVGYGRDAARLAGIKVERRIVLAMVLSSTIACLAGVLETASLGSASPGVGDSFLLPGFAAAFLGSTTIKSGRYNMPGTLIAAILLAVGITGFQLLGAASYIQQFFYGGALIISVAVAQLGVGRLKKRRAPSDAEIAMEPDAVVASVPEPEPSTKREG
jgi:ribose transport system permease protein